MPADTSLPIVKICGLSRDSDIEAVSTAGADLAGFVHFPKSPRHVDLPRMAERVRQAQSAGLKAVAVVVNPDDVLLSAIAAEAKPDLIQLHGHETPERVADIAARFAIPLIKAISVETAQDLSLAAAYEPHVAHLMFDAKTPKDAALPGGLGLSFDWGLLEGLPYAAPWFLAGGLNPGNVAEALKRTNAPMVDVSSGVESAPGLKDASLIHAFVRAAKGF